MVNAAAPPISTRLAQLRFRAETNPQGQAIDLIWEVAPDAQIDKLHMYILRRERRFPGKNRRGVVPVIANQDDLDDGEPIYNSAPFQVGKKDSNSGLIEFKDYNLALFEFDVEQVQSDIEGDQLISTARQFRYGEATRDRHLVRTIRREFVLGNNAAKRIIVRFTDNKNLTPGTIYYYTAFVEDNHYFSRLTQASALATESRASALATSKHPHQLFALLPQIHQTLDNTSPPVGTTSLEDQSKGQLERFLEVFDLHADMLKGMVEGLKELRNPRRVDSRLLPHLAHYLGWEQRETLDEDSQRNEIVFASQVYQTIGTVPNIRAIINRLTGWDAEIREFARNVLLTVDTTRFTTRQSGEPVYLDGSLMASNDIPPVLKGGRRLPPGTINTADAEAMKKLRTGAFDDQTAYTYHAPPRDELLTQDGSDIAESWVRLPNDKFLYNQQTIGIYLTRDVETESFSLKDESERIYQIIYKFLPIQVRVLLFLKEVIVEDPYDAIKNAKEDASDVGLFVQDETYEGGLDTISDQIPEWRWFITNSLEHRSVDTQGSPIDTRSRTWHTALDQGLE